MGIISWIILGLIAGFIGGKIVNSEGQGFWLNIALGIVGAIVGGFLFDFFGASGVTGLNPEIMGLGPIEACRQALARAGMTIDDIDLVEINEAFAAQVIPSAKHLGIPWDKLNVNGGSIALGHPFGMTGARIMTTLLNGLEDAGKTFGLESMCVGGGQGMAMIVERLN